ncbi:DUF1758 domain-containing protein [Trichonephila clavipes]|nr:DUF1758 domain-containing protein [Trichonephila clavipes]
MYKNALKEDLIRVVEELDGETYIQFAARLTANFQYYCSLRKVNSFESLCDLIISDKLFETLNKETATHIGIREAEDWFRPIDLAKECDIYISSKNGSHKEIPITYGYTQDPFKNKSQNFKTKIKENYPQYHERENKNCYICGDSSHCARDYSPLVSMEIPLRTAYSQAGRCGMQPKAKHSLRAQAHLKLELQTFYPINLSIHEKIYLGAIPKQDSTYTKIPSSIPRRLISPSFHKGTQTSPEIDYLKQQRHSYRKKNRFILGEINMSQLRVYWICIKNLEMDFRQPRQATHSEEEEEKDFFPRNDEKKIKMKQMLELPHRCKSFSFYESMNFIKSVSW